MCLRVIVLGAFLETIELCELCGYEIVGIIDNEVKKSFSGYPILGRDADKFSLVKEFNNVSLVNGPDSSIIKKKLYDDYRSAGFPFATVISPKAYISKSAFIDEGCIIQSGVTVSSNVHIGKCCKLNFNCTIMHDVHINDYSILAPNSVVLGRSHIGEGVYIGASATVNHDTNVEDSVIIPSAYFYSK